MELFGRKIVLAVSKHWECWLAAEVDLEEQGSC